MPLELAYKGDTLPVVPDVTCKPIPDEISIHKANSSGNLYQIKFILLQTCTRYDIFFKAVLDCS